MWSRATVATPAVLTQCQPGLSRPSRKGCSRRVMSTRNLAFWACGNGTDQPRHVTQVGRGYATPANAGTPPCCVGLIRLRAEVPFQPQPILPIADGLRLTSHPRAQCMPSRPAATSSSENSSATCACGSAGMPHFQATVARNPHDGSERRSWPLPQRRSLIDATL